MIEGRCYFVTDWIMVIITTIYVIATILICYFNGKSAKAAKIQTDEMIRQYQSMNRPNITIHFDIIRSGLLCFVVQNEGTLPAHNVNININQAFIAGIVDSEDRERVKRFGEAKLYLASSQKIYILLGGQPEFTELARNVAEVDISYDSYTEHTTIDLEQYAMLLVYDSPIEDIAQHLKKIKENDDFVLYRYATEQTKGTKITSLLLQFHSTPYPLRLFGTICQSLLKRHCSPGSRSRNSIYLKAVFPSGFHGKRSSTGRC